MGVSVGLHTNYVLALIIIAVSSIALYLTEKCEHTTLYTINKNIYVTPKK